MSRPLVRKRLVLGEEHDTALVEALKHVLKLMGARAAASAWGVGGSQELIEADFLVGNGTVHVEAETYVGLAVEGDAPVLDEIARRVGERMTTPATEEVTG
jgi:hypothetical protein